MSPRGDAYSKCRRNSQDEMSLKALSCVIEEFLSSLAALLCCTPHYPDAILYRVGNRTGCTRSLVN